MDDRTRELRDVCRFFGHAIVRDGCWGWKADIASNGYARFTIRHRSSLAHRYAYQLLRGPIPAGLTIDHLCRNRACVNPWHLEAVTQKVNTLRSPTSPAAINSRKRVCLHGHPYDGTNVATWGDGKRRSCRACQRAHHRRYYWKALGSRERMQKGRPIIPDPVSVP